MKRTSLLLLLGLLLFACQCKKAEAPKNQYNIIPQPAHLVPKIGQFKVTGDTKILLLTDDEGLRTAASHLASVLIKATGTTVAPATGAEQKDAFLFSIDPSIESEEGYQLQITPYEVNIRAKTGAGAFYAVQTLRQLMPVAAEASPAASLSIPCALIGDAPRYAYRGMHLDVGRHFFGPDDVKKYIDLLALHKFNRFHWHLTDDQGWRLEIKQYPRLQQVASCRDQTLVGHDQADPPRYDGKRHCGFYTQDEARDIVRYAAERFITVVPEIEMPGHAQAAVAAYPELGCTGSPVPVYTRWGVSEDVFCPNEATFAFLENVLAEVMAIFPSKYIHIGGDECPKTQWSKHAPSQALIRKLQLGDEHGLQSYFIQRIEKHLNAQGRSIIGWDEILEGGLAPNATVMSWRGIGGGIAAAKQGHDVIMTPTDFCYFDYNQSQDPDESRAGGGYLPLDKVYSYDPDPADLSVQERQHILGVQGNLWTEYIADLPRLEYMAFPRACALAEVAWSPKEVMGYDGFVARLAQHLKRLRSMGVNAATQIYDVKTRVSAGAGKGIFLFLSPEIEGIDLRYTVDGLEPGPESQVYHRGLAVGNSMTVKAVPYEGDRPVGKGAQLVFRMHKACDGTVFLEEAPAEKYSGYGPGSIVNGVAAPNDRFGDPEWLGFEGKDFVATIHLGQETTFDKVKLRFFNSKDQWIYPPVEAVVSVSTDGKNFAEMARSPISDNGDRVVPLALSLPRGCKGAFVKVAVKRFGLIPAGAPGAGNEAWLFVDEVVVESD